MYRFFIDFKQIEGNTIKIFGKDVKHIKDVLRLRPKDKIEVVCEGYVYLTEIIDINSNYVITDIVNGYLGENEPPIDIILYQGIAKGDKMDFIIQKGTEIGIKEFYPIMTNRTVVKIKDKKKEENRLKRWRGIAEEAAKQSKRDILPIVRNIMNFNEMIDILKYKKNIIVPYEMEKTQDLNGVFKNIEKEEIHLIIGPEGGFEELEIRSLSEIGGQIITLGPRILRTETAGIVVSSIALYELGDLGVIR